MRLNPRAVETALRRKTFSLLGRNFPCPGRWKACRGPTPTKLGYRIGESST